MVKSWLSTIVQLDETMPRVPRIERRCCETFLNNCQFLRYFDYFANFSLRMKWESTIEHWPSDRYLKFFTSSPGIMKTPQLSPYKLMLFTLQLRGGGVAAGFFLELRLIVYYTSGKSYYLEFVYPQIFIQSSWDMGDEKYIAMHPIKGGAGKCAIIIDLLL